MRIAIFGSEKCKFCGIQQEYLKNTFGNKDWVYLDVLKDKDMLKLAKKLDLENMPTIVLFDENAQEFFRTEGTLSADKIFKKIYNNNSLPFNDEEQKQLSSSRGYLLLSYNPDIKDSTIIQAKNYHNKHICDISVRSTIKMASKEILTSFGKEAFENYINKGGREDFAWVVKYKVI